jgi:5-formyltetrahydrofolate cyclo-ligase
VAIQPTTPEKIQLRSEMRRQLNDHAHDSLAIVDALDQWLATLTHGKTIAVFAALPGEIDLSDVVARHPHQSWVYPRVIDDTLSFHRVKDPQHELSRGTFNILEPLPDLPIVPCEHIDIFLCPGLAFDHHGGRLGRGRGFYDRVLANARPDAQKIGVCYPFQIVDDVHSADHDIPMDRVISGSNKSNA